MTKNDDFTLTNLLGYLIFFFGLFNNLLMLSLNVSDSGLVSMIICFYGGTLATK